MGARGCPEEAPNLVWKVREGFLEAVMSELRPKGELAGRREKWWERHRGIAHAKRKC